ncbi:MAG: tryptophan-rich sensory protein [Ruminococcaceae bacterium]|nr:tryptophan-rich sensory protein [Oscillospiraceae bacterium]
MKLKKWLPYIISAGIALGVGVLSGLLSMNGMEVYAQNTVKPALTPPGWVFAAVWTVLYILMGISAARIWLLPDSPGRSKGLNLYVAQLIMNFFWSLIFFNLRAYGFAVLWLLGLWILVFLMIRDFYKLDKTAAYLQIPYLIWLTFAAYLNIGVWVLNS